MARFVLQTGLVWLLLAPMVALGQADRDSYRAALKALQRNQVEEFDRLSAALVDYPLFPYLQLARLGRDIRHADAAAVRDLLDRYSALPPARRLRTEWLKRLARERRWPEFVADYRGRQSMTLQCQFAAARLRASGTVDFEPELWLVGQSQPDACDAVFAHWASTGVLTPARYFERAVLAAAAGSNSLARYLARRAGEIQTIERAIALRANPSAQLIRALDWDDTAAHRNLIVATLQKLKSRRNSLARSRWSVLRDKLAFSAAQKAAVDRDLALFYATDYPPDALDVLKALAPESRDQQILEWTVRVALKLGDWAGVLESLQQMSAGDATRDRWLYWRGRALQQLGNETQARAVFQTLAGRANYFGFLAAERVGQRYTLCPEPRNPNPRLLADLSARPAMRRALELQALEQWHDARSEWNLALAGLNREQRFQAALLAASEGWHDRAVLTLADTGHQQRYQIRFPLVWQDDIDRFASEFGLNPSLVFAVMRSESALVVDAQSGANAHGLMQLTPQTAREVAGILRIAKPTRQALRQPELNLRLGSAYLGQLFTRYGHPLLVLAAYNAGPDALERWLKMDLPHEADRWIETLPYFETRDYVMRVLAFAAIYDWRRDGKMIALSLRSPPMDSRPGVTDLGVTGTVVPQCLN